MLDSIKSVELTAYLFLKKFTQSASDTFQHEKERVEFSIKNPAQDFVT